MSGWESRAESGLCVQQRALDTRPFLASVLVALLSSHLQALVFVFTVNPERLHMHGMCVAALGPRPSCVGVGSPAFLSTASEINSWVWAGLLGWEGWSLRSLIVPIN